jgi:membrane protease YdiL (CAAX protease family)
VWFVSLELTKQRIVFEAQNKLHSIQTLQSPYVWDFVHFNQDVVESFQSYWHKDLAHSIQAKQASNPQLSLNFSGQTLNPLLHDKLFIYSKKALQGKLKIQIKSHLDDRVFYYSPLLDLSGKVNEINLNQVWKGYKASGKTVDSVVWDNDLTKVSSLVLIFSNPIASIEIDKIELPYSHQKLTTTQVSVNCEGQIGALPTNTLIQFELNQGCLLPSNYLWLKHSLAMLYPESILSIKGVKSWQKTSVHQVNKSYTSNTLLNSILYGVLVSSFGVIFWLRRKYATEERGAYQESWYKWTAKQMLFRGAQKAIKPYHLLINYAIVLVPTIVVLIVMAFFHFPELHAFKKLPQYFIWAVLQQFFLGYVLAQRIFYTRTENRLLSALLAASVFSLLHIPSATLMLVTFVAGGLWAYAFLVFKRLLPLALSHAVLALMFYHVVSDRILYTAKVMQWFWE